MCVCECVCVCVCVTFQVLHSTDKTSHSFTTAGGGVQQVFFASRYNQQHCATVLDHSQASEIVIKLSHPHTYPDKTEDLCSHLAFGIIENILIQPPTSKRS